MIHLNNVHQSRAVVPLYVEHPQLRDEGGFLEPIEMIPGTEVRLTVNIDVTLSAANPKRAEVVELAKKLSALVEEAEETADAPELNNFYVSQAVAPTHQGLAQCLPQKVTCV